MQKFIPGVVLLALLTVGTVSADTVGPLSSSHSTSLTDWSDSLTFPKFDPSLGTLTGVKFDLSSSLQTVLTVTNTAPSGSNGYAKTEVILTVTDAGSYMGAPQLDFFSPAYNFSLAAGHGNTSGTLLKSASDSWTYSDAGTLGEFTGSGNISLAAGTLTNAVISYSGGNTDAVQVTDASALGQVTYFYNPPSPVPLPVAVWPGLAMLGGLGGWSWLRRRA